MHAPPIQLLPGLQSAGVWHGQAHFPTAVLQRCRKQLASDVHCRAIGDGCDIVPAGAGCPGAGAGCPGTGAGVGAGVAAGAG
jgi:hypothetical protein